MSVRGTAMPESKAPPVPSFRSRESSMSRGLDRKAWSPSRRMNSERNPSFSSKCAGKRARVVLGVKRCSAGWSDRIRLGRCGRELPGMSPLLVAHAVGLIRRRISTKVRTVLDDETVERVGAGVVGKVTKVVDETLAAVVQRCVAQDPEPCAPLELHE